MSQPESQPVKRNIVLAILLSGAFIIILNQTLLNTALPTFMEEFGITENAAQWVTTVFMLVNGVMIPVTAFLIEKFSTRKLFMAAMLIFSVGTAICAAAPSFGVLLLGRVVQAASGGMIMPLMQTIVFAMFSFHRRGSAMGTLGLVISFAPAIGPSLSGWIVDNMPWQTLFIMMLPIALIDAVFAYFLLRNVTENTNPKLDFLSLTLSTIGFGGLLFGFSTAGSAGWGSANVIGPLVVGLLALVWFTRRQLTLEKPMLDIRVLSNPMFTLGTLLGMTIFVVMIGGMLILPLYMQNMADFTAMESGIALLPGAVVMGVVSPITGRVFDRFGGKWLSFFGFILATASTFMLARLSLDTTLEYLAIVNAVRMLGVAMVIMPVTTAALNELPQRMIPHGTAVNNTLRQISSSIGAAVMVTIMTATVKDPAVYGIEGVIHGANVAFIVSGSLGILGIIGSLFIRNRQSPAASEIIEPQE